MTTIYPEDTRGTRGQAAILDPGFWILDKDEEHPGCWAEYLSSIEHPVSSIGS
jgi:hypothetical protein